MTSQFSKISIVVPVYNEDDVLEQLHGRLDAVLAGLGVQYEVVFVDDGSRDKSREVLARLSAASAKVRVLELARNFGQTAALAAGIDYASGDVIITMDGDLQHTPEDIPRFLAKLGEGFDVVSGWRETRTDNFWLRRIPSLCANWLMRFVSGISIKDFGSTYKAYRADLVKRVELFGELHRFIPVLANRIGARMTEIPIIVAPRKQGVSKYGLTRAFGVFEDLVFLEFYSNYLTKPIRAFGRLFFVFFGIGFSISILLMFLWFIGLIGPVREHGALLLFSVLLMIMGIQFLVAGVLAELLTRIYLHTSNNKIYTVRRVLGGDKI